VSEPVSTSCASNPTFIAHAEAWRPLATQEEPQGIKCRPPSPWLGHGGDGAEEMTCDLSFSCHARRGRVRMAARAPNSNRSFSALVPEILLAAALASSGLNTPHRCCRPSRVKLLTTVGGRQPPSRGQRVGFSPHLGGTASPAQGVRAGARGVIVGGERGDGGAPHALLPRRRGVREGGTPQLKPTASRHRGVREARAQRLLYTAH